MRLIPVTEILVHETRQRREFDPASLVALQESIERLGLMHPVVVRDGHILVAGERRLRAIREIWALDNSFHCDNVLVPVGQVPCVELGELSPLEAMEAELDENTKRADLTWQELALATTRLHEFRQAQAAARGESHSIMQTAFELKGHERGEAYESTRAAILISKHLSNPDVAKASSAKDALKILIRAEDAARNVELTARVGATFGAHSHTLLLGECVSTMAGLLPASFDIILTDPPYGMGANDFGDGAGRFTAITHDYDDSEDSFRTLMGDVAGGVARVAKDAAHLYLCCDIDQFPFLKDLFTSVGAWHVFRTPLINRKRGSGRVPLPEHGPRRQYELILYAYRGGKRTTAIYDDVIETGADAQLGHGAQKPVALFENLLRRSARPGDRVLDPFAGTGTVFPAAHALKVAATGIELEPSYYGIAVKRIEALDAELEVTSGTA